MLKPALIGGVALGILSAIPVLGAVNCFCCAWVIGGGILAANLYVKSSVESVTLGRGLVLGLLTGVIGGVVETLLSIPLQMIMASMGTGALSRLEQMLEQMKDLPPEVREALRSILSNQGGAGIFFIIVGGFFTLLVFSVMGMIGGAIGVAIFEKRKPGQGTPGAAPPPYQPPADQ